jgi:uncharacterized protein
VPAAAEHRIPLPLAGTPRGLSRGRFLRFQRGGRELVFATESASIVELSGAALELVKMAESGHPLTPSALQAELGLRHAGAEVGQALAQLVGLGVLRDSQRPLITPMPGRASGPATMATIVLQVARGCNLRCGYCYADHGLYGDGPKQMEIDVARRYIDLLFDSSGDNRELGITFFGGEPLMAFPVVQAAAAYARERAARAGKRVNFGLTTNGTLVTAEHAAFFDEYDVSVTVSMDGGRGTQNRLRVYADGRGSYEQIVARLPLLTGGQRQLACRVTVTKQDLAVRELVHHLLGLGFTEVGVSPVSSDDPKYGLDAADLARLDAEMALLADDYRQAARRGVKLGFTNLTNLLRQLHEGGARPYPCGAGIQLYAGDGAGNLYACHRFTGGALGTLEHGIDAAKRAAWVQNVHVDSKTDCQTCWARSLCGGGCHHIGDTMLGDPRSTYVPLCDWLRSYYRLGLELFLELGETQPEFLERLTRGRSTCRES